MCNFSNSKMRRAHCGKIQFFVQEIKFPITSFLASKFKINVAGYNLFFWTKICILSQCGAAAGHFAFLSLKKTRKIYADSQGRNSIVMTWHKWKLMMEILCCDIHQQSCLNIEKYYKISRIIIDWFIINIKDKLLIEICS